VKNGLLSRWARLARLPVERLSTPRTELAEDWARRASVRWEPRKPAAPVTRIFFI
jgi:hypothetical protein